MAVPSDEPQTDREWLTRIDSKLNNLTEKIDGKEGICILLRKHDARISTLENWRWYIIGGISVLTLIGVIWGRLIDINVIQP